MRSFNTVLAAVSLAIFGCAAAPKDNTFSGYYRQGFEQSDFYALDGDGPYWLDGEPEVWGEIMSHVAPKPGRGSSVTLKLTVEGSPETGGGYGHLGAYDGRLYATRIVTLKRISESDYAEAVERFLAPR